MNRKVILSLIVVAMLFSIENNTKLYSQIEVIDNTYIDSIKEKTEAEEELLQKIEENIKNNDYSKAFELYKNLINEYPKSEYIIDFGLLYAKQSKYNEAHKVWKKLYDLDRNAYLKLEDYYLKYQLYDKLLELYLIAYDIETNKSSYSLTKRIIKMYNVLNMIDEKYAFISNMIKDENSNLYSFHIDTEINYIIENELDDTKFITSLEILIESDDIDNKRKAEILKYLAELHLNRERYKASFEVSKKTIDLYIELLHEGKTHNHKVNLTFMNFIDDFESIQMYEYALFFINRYIEILNNEQANKFLELKNVEARIYKRQKKHMSSLLSYREIISFLDGKFIPKNKELINDNINNQTLKDETYFNIAEIYYEIRNFKYALVNLEKIKTQDFLDKDINLLFGKCYMATKEYNKAEEYFYLSFVKSNYRKPNTASIYYMAVISMIKNQYAKALNMFEKLITESDESNSILITESLIMYEILITIFEDKNRYDEFIKFIKMYHSFEYEKLLKLEKYLILNKFNLYEIEKFYYHFTIIDILINMNKDEQAISYLKTDINNNALKNIANGFYYQKAVYKLCELYLISDDIEKHKKAKEILMELLIEYPDTVFLQSIKEKLRL